MPHPMEDQGVRREFIKHVYGIDILDPFDLTVFPDDTVAWQPVTILLAWLTMALSEMARDVEPGDAYRVAKARVPKLRAEDWDEFVMRARSWGIRLADADETQTKTEA